MITLACAISLVLFFATLGIRFCFRHDPHFWVRMTWQDSPNKVTISASSCGYDEYGFCTYLVFGQELYTPSVGTYAVTSARPLHPPHGRMVQKKNTDPLATTSCVPVHFRLFFPASA